MDASVASVVSWTGLLQPARPHIFCCRTRFSRGWSQSYATKHGSRWMSHFIHCNSDAALAACVQWTRLTRCRLHLCRASAPPPPHMTPAPTPMADASAFRSSLARHGRQWSRGARSASRRHARPRHQFRSRVNIWLLNQQQMCLMIISCFADRLFIVLTNIFRSFTF